MDPTTLRQNPFRNPEGRIEAEPRSNHAYHECGKNGDRGSDGPPEPPPYRHSNEIEKTLHDISPTFRLGSPSRPTLAQRKFKVPHECTEILVYFNMLQGAGTRDSSFFLRQRIELPCVMFRVSLYRVSI